MECYVGEIRMFAGNFAPQGWAFCDGSLLSIAENEMLFSLLGTTFGGDGVNNFALPDLRGRIPLGIGPGYPQGQKGGTETVTLQPNQMPVHTHPVNAMAAAGTTGHPGNAIWAQAAQSAFVAATADKPMNPQAISSAGGNQPHENMMPFLAVSFIISLYGVYPTQS